MLEQKNEITSNLSSDSQTGKKITFKQNLFPLLKMTELPFFVFFFVLFFCLFFFCLFFVLFYRNLYYRYVGSISEVKDKLNDL